MGNRNGRRQERNAAGRRGMRIHQAPGAAVRAAGDGDGRTVRDLPALHRFRDAVRDDREEGRSGPARRRVRIRRAGHGIATGKGKWLKASVAGRKAGDATFMRRRIAPLCAAAIVLADTNLCDKFGGIYSWYTLISTRV